MKKRALVLCLLMLQLAIAPGCVKCRFQADVDKNGDVSAVYRVVAVPGMKDELDEGVADLLHNDNVQVIEVEEGNMLGYDFLFSKMTFDELAAKFSNDNSDAFHKKLGLAKDTYTVNLVLNDEAKKWVSDLASIPLPDAASLVVNLPEPVISSNAARTVNNGQTLIWDPQSIILQSEPKISLKFAIPRPLRLAVVLILLFLLLGGASGIGVYVAVKARKRSSQVVSAQKNFLKAQPQAEQEFMFCTKCGCKLTLDSEFCIKCGARTQDRAYADNDVQALSNITIAGNDNASVSLTSESSASENELSRVESAGSEA